MGDPARGPPGWPDPAQKALARFWTARIARQKEIDASIAAKAEFEFLYDKPFANNTKVRVAGPFTVESLSLHKTLVTDWNDELFDLHEAPRASLAGKYLTEWRWLIGWRLWLLN